MAGESERQSERPRSLAMTGLLESGAFEVAKILFFYVFATDRVTTKRGDACDTQLSE